MITIGYFGDGPWAHKAFEKFVHDKNIVIKFVSVRYDRHDSELIKLAEKNRIPVELFENINSEESLEILKGYNVDLFVSMSFNQIFQARTMNLPSLKTINCHAGKLPYYRGRNILNWVLINDDSEFGITVHYVDEGIDTGDIILQRTYPITDTDDYGTLLERAYTGCAEILYDAVMLIQEDKVKRIKQDTIDPIGMYCGIRKLGDEVVNWNSNSRELFNFVRAICRPGPMATTYLNGKEMKINKVVMIKGARDYINKPGQVLKKTVNGFYVKTRDTFLEVVDYEFDGKIKVGDVLGGV